MVMGKTSGHCRGIHQQAELQNKLNWPKKKPTNLSCRSCPQSSRSSIQTNASLPPRSKRKSRTSLYYPQVTLHRAITLSDEAGSRMGRAVVGCGPTPVFGLDSEYCAPDQHRSLCVCCGLQAAHGFLQFPTEYFGK